MKILILEDDAEKLRNLMSVILKVEGVKHESVFHQIDSNGVKRFLASNHVDVLVLDLHVPDRFDLSPSTSGGLDLLKSLMSRPSLNVPTNVITISGNPEALSDAVKGGDLWGVIRYDTTSNAWREQLRSRLLYIKAALTSQAAQTHRSVDVAIVTALDEELASFLSLPVKWEDLGHSGDATRYHSASLETVNGEVKLVACTASRMGMAASAALSAKVIQTFRPQYLIMGGVTGGLRGKVELGDILVADPSWDWGSGKFEIEDHKPVFSPNPEQLRISPDVRNDLIQLAQDTEMLGRIKSSFKGSRPNHDLGCHVAAVATGAAVLSDEAVLRSIKQHNRKIYGVEMEIYGMMMAVDTCSRPRPLAFAAKSVSDFADSTKDDGARGYALHSSSSFILEFIKRQVNPRVT